MRTLSSSELTTVSGGTLCLLSLFMCKPKVVSCKPKPVCKPPKSCRPPCGTTPTPEPEPEPEIN